MNWFHRHLRFFLSALFVCFALGFISGCGKEPAPEPTAETKEERREKEKEMMHREMTNK